MRAFLTERIQPRFPGTSVRGLGLAWAVDLGPGRGEQARAITARSFERGLVIERCGRGGTAIKLLPPLTIALDRLEAGCTRLLDAMSDVLTA